jgi:hypothetical protein
MGACPHKPLFVHGERDAASFAAKLAANPLAQQVLREHLAQAGVERFALLFFGSLCERREIRNVGDFHPTNRKG